MVQDLLRRSPDYFRCSGLSLFDMFAERWRQKPRATTSKRIGLDKRFAQQLQPSATGFGGLRLRRARVRTPSVTPSFAGKMQLSAALAESCGSSRAAVELNCDMLAAVVDKSTSRSLIFTTLFKDVRGHRVVS